jgi:ABC-type antimicrobial peptide transport system permease subunit
MFFRSGVKVSVTGLLIGLPLAVASMKLLSTMGGMPQVDMPIVIGSVAAAVIIVASLASWIPARRAAGVDPLIALRDG